MVGTGQGHEALFVGRACAARPRAQPTEQQTDSAVRGPVRPAAFSSRAPQRIASGVERTKGLRTSFFPTRKDQDGGLRS